MNDPRQPVLPRIPGMPNQPAAAPQHPQPAAPQQPRPLSRPVQQPQHAMPAQHPSPSQHPTHAPHAPQGPARIAPMPTMPAPAQNDDDAIALIEDGEDAVTLHKKIKAFGQEGQKAAAKWNRQTTASHEGSAVRVRTFHAKLSDQGLEYLDDAINHFIDDHPEVHVKYVTTNIGMFDGKFKDLALIVNVWY